MSTLYELRGQYKAIMDLTYDVDDEKAEVQNALDMVKDEINVKVGNGIGLIRSLEALIESIEDEKRRLGRRQAALERRVKYIQEYYIDNLKSMGLNKVITPRGVMSVARAGGRLPLIIEDESKIPSEYKVEIPSKKVVDKETLRLALEAGEEVEGAHLEARKEYLRLT